MFSRPRAASGRSGGGGAGPAAAAGAAGTRRCGAEPSSPRGVAQARAGARPGLAAPCRLHAGRQRPRHGSSAPPLRPPGVRSGVGRGSGQAGAGSSGSSGARGFLRGEPVPSRPGGRRSAALALLRPWGAPGEAWRGAQRRRPPRRRRDRHPPPVAAPAQTAPPAPGPGGRRGARPPPGAGGSGAPAPLPEPLPERSGSATAFVRWPRVAAALLREPGEFPGPQRGCPNPPPPPSPLPPSLSPPRPRERGPELGLGQAAEGAAGQGARRRAPGGFQAAGAERC